MSSHNPNLDQPSEPTDSAEARMRLALGLGTRPANPGHTPPASGPAPASHDAVRQRRRFAQDGDVPVVMLHRGRDAEAGGENKLAALTAELREERTLRLKAERALEEANQIINSLKTKLKHAEMTLDEKLAADAEARAQVDALLVTEREARQQAEARAAEAALALSVLERRADTAPKTAAVQPAFIEPEAAPQAPDLFAGTETAAAPAAAAKRRMSKKADAQPEPVPTPVSATPDQVTDDALTQVDGAEDTPIEWWLPSFRAARKTPVRRKRASG